MEKFSFILFSLVLVLVATVVADTGIDYTSKINISIQNDEVKLWVYDSKDSDIINQSLGPWYCDENITRVYDLEYNDIPVESMEIYDIANLTKALIDVNSKVVQSCGTNLSQDYINCVDGRARAAEVHDRCRVDRDQYNNESALYKGLWEASCDNSTKWYDQWNSCEESIGKKQIEINSLTTEVNGLRGKPIVYGVVALIVGIIGTTIFHRKQFAKSSEASQFGQG